MTISRFFSARLAAVVVAVASTLAAAPAQAADTYAQTRYPVVLVPGMLGFEAIGPINYFYGVPSALRGSGATVFTPAVSALNSNEARGEQLLAQLRQLKAAYGYTRFNLIGHSQGGATARYVAAVAPELVASVTTVGAPHQGSAVADVVKQVTAVTGTTPLVSSIMNALGAAISFVSGTALPQQSLGTLQSLNTAGAADFNRRFPQGAPTTACGQGPATVNGIRYYSVSGTAPVTNVLDVSDAVMGITGALFKGEANDGLVSRCSSHWGTVLRDDYGWNHLDEVNQAFGLRNFFAADPVAFYRSQANRLKLAGL
jgi:triacylglycerol lipase